MAKRIAKNTSASKTVPNRARCTVIAQQGISTGLEFRNFMSALMTDLVCGSVAPNIGNAACNAGGKLLNAYQIEKREQAGAANGKRVISLALKNPLIEAE